MSVAGQPIPITENEAAPVVTEVEEGETKESTPPRSRSGTRSPTPPSRSPSPSPPKSKKKKKKKTKEHRSRHRDSEDEDRWSRKRHYRSRSRSPRRNHPFRSRSPPSRQRVYQVPAGYKLVPEKAGPTSNYPRRKPYVPQRRKQQNVYDYRGRR